MTKFLQQSLIQFNNLKQQYNKIRNQIYGMFGSIIKQCIASDYKFKIINREGIWYIRTIKPAVASDGFVVIDDNAQYMSFELNYISNIKIDEDEVTITMKQKY